MGSITDWTLDPANISIIIAILALVVAVVSFIQVWKSSKDQQILEVRTRSENLATKWIARIDRKGKQVLHDPHKVFTPELKENMLTYLKDIKEVLPQVLDMSRKEKWTKKELKTALYTINRIELNTQIIDEALENKAKLEKELSDIKKKIHDEIDS